MYKPKKIKHKQNIVKCKFLFLLSIISIIIGELSLSGDLYALARETLGEKRTQSYLLRDLITKIDQGYLLSFDGEISKQASLTNSSDHKTSPTINRYHRYYLQTIKPHLKLVEDALSKEAKVSFDKRISEFEALIAQSDHRHFYYLREIIVDHFQITTNVTIYPNYFRGAKLYQQYCQSCHGKKGKGDGELASRFDGSDGSIVKKDLSLVTDRHLRRIYPHLVYNLLITGLPSGVMSTLEPVLSKNKIWDLAFYTVTLGFDCEKYAIENIDDQSFKIKNGLDKDQHLSKALSKDKKNHNNKLSLQKLDKPIPHEELGLWNFSIYQTLSAYRQIPNNQITKDISSQYQKLTSQDREKIKKVRCWIVGDD